MFKTKKNNNKLFRIAGLIYLISNGYLSELALADEKGLSLSDSIKMTLELSPTRFIQQANVTAAQAGVQVQEGAFNPMTSAGLNYGQNYEPLNHVANGALAGPGFTGGDSKMVFAPACGTMATPCYVYNNYWGRSLATAHAELSKYFESGINATVSVADTRLNQINLSSDSRPNANTSQINLKLNIPLLKNGGTESAAGFLNSARKGQEAAVQDYTFFLTGLANDVIHAYWDYKLAVDSLKIRENSRDRVTRIASQVNLFADNPKMREKIAQVIYTAEGAKVSKNRVVVEAQQAMEQARTNFALTLGVPPEQFTTIAQPTDEIPSGIIPVSFDSKKVQSNWEKIAVENRLDLQAARSRQEAVKFVVDKAERDLYPQVDLNLAVGYQGLKEGSSIGDMATALSYNVPGPTWATGVEFSYPLGNDAAEGTLKKAQANYRQAELSVYQTTRTIDASVLVISGFVDRYVQAIGHAQQAVKENTAALAAWKRAPLTDPSSILGMLQTEEQLTTSTLTELQIRAEYAKLVADIRFKTGLLGKITGEEDYSLSFNELTELPH